MARVARRIGWDGARAACLLLALATSCPPVGAANPTPEAPERTEQARQRGFWVIAKGEHLLRIARNFTASEPEAGALARELKALNESAFIGGDATRLIVGARLTLPPRYRDGAPTVTQVALPAPATPKALATTPATPVASGPPKASAQPPASAPLSTIYSASSVPPIAANTLPPAEPLKAATPAIAPYVDRVLSGPSDEREVGLDEKPRDTSPGLRQWAAEYRSDYRRLTDYGTTRADGVAARYFMETERSGDFTLLAQATTFDTPPLDPRGSRSLVTGTLLHENFTLPGGAIANSALGVVRPLFPVWLSTSYRVTFTPSLLEGVRTTIGTPESELRLGAGRIGQLTGVGIQQFERTSGDEAIASFTQRLGSDWSAGAAAISVRDSATIANHTTVSAGVGREFSPTGPGIKLQAAVTDDGERAAWTDIIMRNGRLTQRFGGYYVDPDFVFGESAATRDIRGAYWRGEYRDTQAFYSFGAEGSQDNLKRDPTRAGTNNIGGYGNVTLRVDRTLQVGGGFSARNENPRLEGEAGRQVSMANAFLSKSWLAGVTRLDANYNLTRPDNQRNESTRFLQWNQEWPRTGPVDFSTQLGLSNESLVDRDVRRRLASVQARGPIYGDLRWDASVTFVDVDDPRGSERNYNAAVTLDWNVAPQWSLQLLWFRNRVQPGADNPLSPFLREDAIQFNARYEDSAGSPYPRVAGGRSGTGRVAGSVFFDENGDGERQANERGAPGVQVILDERQSAVTDNDGRFQFAFVPSGTHRVRVLVERVPLPWGLADDAQREVRVDVRGDARLDIGLTRISP
ncbi:hypothetical protein BWI17_01225 [Betaproteobacteria bacterium GR16-43]|nr:hypothetical protein BWI17_01225 [Betaproteobacteria bacterium GR16-43]